ncbi:putative effector protein [Aphelenchoides bicaudatus]|nr:putative effector protein [Aphelenchoides bicaudatus]
MLLRICVLCSLLVINVHAVLKTEDELTTEDAYKVLRVTPTTAKQLEAIAELYRQSTDLQLDFWKTPTQVGQFADIMVPPDSLEIVLDYLKEHQLEYTVTIQDVQRLILQREKSKFPSWARPNSSALNDPLLASFFRKRMSDDYSSSNKARYGFGEYHSYDEMIRWMQDIERFYPQMAQTFTIGRTHEGREIKGIKIGFPISETNKRAVWIDGGIHFNFIAREWAAIHTSLYFVEQLIVGYNVDPKVTAYVNTLNFYIVPVANPDGFEFSRSDVTPQVRFWRKNKSPEVCHKDHWRRDRCCQGVDLNRNFDFHWAETGSSSDICSDIYAGTNAFSEPEARAIRDKILSPELRGKLDAYLTLHTYSQMWIHPYNHATKSFPEDIQDLVNVGKQGVNAIESMYGTKFRFGTGADILYPSAGGSDDWAKAKAGVKYVYLLELRPGEDEWDGFLLDKRQLVPTGRETWEGIKVVLDAVMRKAHVNRPAAPVQQTPRFQSTATVPQSPATISTQRWTITQSTATTPQPITTTRPFAVGRRVNEENLRHSLHDRLQRLRLSQMEARRRFEEQVRKQNQFQIQPGQTFLQFGPPQNVPPQTRQQQNNLCVDRSKMVCSMDST